MRVMQRVDPIRAEHIGVPDRGVARQSEFSELRTMGVDSYPTLVVHAPDGLYRLGGPVSGAAGLTEALDRYIAAA